MNLSEALALWLDVTNVDPQQRSFTFGDLSVMGMHKALQEALELDPTEITGRMLFDFVATRYFKDRSFSVNELLNEPERVAKYLAKSRDLMAYLRGPEITEISVDFAARVTAAVERYGAATQPVLELLEQDHALALLRRDALRTMSKLTVHQFLDGEPSPPDVRPVFGKYVYRWSSVNTMLDAMTKAPPGVTLNLIANREHPLRSYFAFAIRNGARLFIFTDKEATPHPLAEDLRRRPDKIFAERAARNWFPYDLAGLAFSDEGDVYLKSVDSKALVPHQSATEPVRAIAELDAPEVLWVTMMLDLIVDKFWSQGYRAPKLSFTGEMVINSQRLLAAATEANLPVVMDGALALPPITFEQVRTVDPTAGLDAETSAMVADALGDIEGVADNRWLEERYGARANAEALNLVDRGDRKLMIAYSDGVVHGAVQERDEEQERSLFRSDREELELKRVIVDALDPTSIGTREELQADRVFLARSNYARQIDRFARVEFEERREEVRKWVGQRVHANLHALLPLFAQRRTLVPEVPPCPPRGQTDQFSGAMGWHGFDGGVSKRGLAECVEIEDHHRTYGWMEWSGRGRLSFGGEGRAIKGIPRCWLTNAPSRYFGKIYPENSGDLARLCGCEHFQLPDVLQHWTLRRRRSANHILNRVDPLAWQLHDPWADLYFEVVVFLSARAVAKIRKEHGVPQATAESVT